MGRYCLIGHPLGHSLSPQIHQRLFALEGLQEEYTLESFPPDQLPVKLPLLRQMNGFNITIPYKQEIIPFLEGLDESARLYGAVNTVARRGNRLVGYNTDCSGFLRTMSTHGVSLRTTVCVVGAGGVGRMFAIECARQGAQVTIAVRKPSLHKALSLSQEILEKTGVTAQAAEIETLNQPFGLLINATPVGMFPKTGVSPVSKELLAQVDTVFDCVYNPQYTQLLMDAKELGKKALGGMDMLVWQAAVAHEIWHDSTFTQEEINRIIRETQALLEQMEAAHE